ncbi:leucine-rich repeat domain-containing protein [Butyrivibrio sp. AE3004]|uniref:leucine-rich repeat domain-containing protein n=1 Tax=Butyrivibrio sp. AE3004 TaxID=1506994 RepID=UPI000493BA2E|nr:leucine-rich repeat domain-containing protein [Butyrivibrio sp. AE3004]
MKTKLLLTTLAAALSFSLFAPTTVAEAASPSSTYTDANGNVHVDNSIQKNVRTLGKKLRNEGDLKAPTNLTWSTEKHGLGSFETVDQEAYYFAWLEDSEGNSRGSWHMGHLKAGTHTVQFYRNIDNSGTYKFRVKAGKNDQDYDKDTGAISEYSATYSYTKPSQTMAVATNLAWSKDKPGTATWTTVDNAEAYLVNLLRDDGTNKKYIIGLYVTGDKSEVDFTKYLGDSGDQKYYFNIKTYSKDIEAIANSDLSANSDALDGSKIDTSKKNDDNKDTESKEVTAESTKEAIASASDGKAAETALDAYIGKVDKNALAVAMQTDSSQKQKIVDMEEAYKQKANVSVTNNITARGIDASKVKLVGAGLNAGANSSVSFNVSATDENSKKAINTNLYKNVVQFDMNLSNASKVAADGTLAIPVEITMPVPEGFKSDHTLHILHFHHSDDGFDLIDPRFNSDGTISFTITHFSVFAFADELTINEVVKDAEGNTYKVTADKVVQFVSSKDKKITKLTIPDTVKLGDTTCTVTSIADNAVKGCKKLTTVAIGKNVTTIGKGAFQNDKKLKTIKINNPSLSKVGKNAFKGISSNASFKLKGTKKEKTAVKKILSKKNTGYKKTMKIK